MSFNPSVDSNSSSPWDAAGGTHALAIGNNVSRKLIVAFAFYSTTPSGWNSITITFNGVTVPLLVGRADGASGNYQTAIFGLDNPASGTHNLVWSGLPIASDGAKLSHIVYYSIYNAASTDVTGSLSGQSVVPSMVYTPTLMPSVAVVACAAKLAVNQSLTAYNVNTGAVLTSITTSAQSGYVNAFGVTLQQTRVGPYRTGFAIPMTVSWDNAGIYQANASQCLTDASASLHNGIAGDITTFITSDPNANNMTCVWDLTSPTRIDSISTTFVGSPTQGLRVSNNGTSWVDPVLTLNAVTLNPNIIGPYYDSIQTHLTTTKYRYWATALQDTSPINLYDFRVNYRDPISGTVVDLTPGIPESGGGVGICNGAVALSIAGFDGPVNLPIYPFNWNYLTGVDVSARKRVLRVYSDVDGSPYLKVIRNDKAAGLTETIYQLSSGRNALLNVNLLPGVKHQFQLFGQTSQHAPDLANKVEFVVEDAGEGFGA